ncbi:hypothetical protein AVEN_130896-1 [Araneus ventricosus]|uniref:Uncharacterized protein n=1 Tax=Araneus ventricosus TaxID=182803 RepID=A0A4Y2QZB9_ARAVE|nr:hypothetical protein AVEN_130896-1 [Araneus ventricosus]
MEIGIAAWGSWNSNVLKIQHFMRRFQFGASSEGSDRYVSLAIPARIRYDCYGRRFRTEFCMRPSSSATQTELTKMASRSKTSSGLQELIQYRVLHAIFLVGYPDRTNRNGVPFQDVSRVTRIDSEQSSSCEQRNWRWRF